MVPAPVPVPLLLLANECQAARQPKLGKYPHRSGKNQRR
jgi:hypothetical protein